MIYARHISSSSTAQFKILYQACVSVVGSIDRCLRLQNTYTAYHILIITTILKKSRAKVNSQFL